MSICSLAKTMKIKQVIETIIEIEPKEGYTEAALNGLFVAGKINFAEVKRTGEVRVSPGEGYDGYRVVGSLSNMEIDTNYHGFPKEAADSP